MCYYDRTLKNSSNVNLRLKFLTCLIPQLNTPHNCKYTSFTKALYSWIHVNCRRLQKPVGEVAHCGVYGRQGLKAIFGPTSSRTSRIKMLLNYKIIFLRPRDLSYFIRTARAVVSFHVGEVVNKCDFCLLVWFLASTDTTVVPTNWLPFDTVWCNEVTLWGRGFVDMSRFRGSNPKNLQDLGRKMELPAQTFSAQNQPITISMRYLQGAIANFRITQLRAKVQHPVA